MPKTNEEHGAIEMCASFSDNSGADSQDSVGSGFWSEGESKVGWVLYFELGPFQLA
jgi:hypothetical protein